MAGSYDIKKRLSKAKARNVVRDLCIAYLESFPGLPNPANNIVINRRAHLIIAGKEISDEAIDFLHSTLAFRMGKMQMATAYAKLLKLEFNDCREFDVEGWQVPLLSSAYDTKENAKYRAFEQTCTDILQRRVFPPAPKTEDLDFLKPERYLAIALVEKLETEEEMNDAIYTLIQRKSA